jgi:hypothetical protein
MRSVGSLDLGCLSTSQSRVGKGEERKGRCWNPRERSLNAGVLRNTEGTEVPPDLKGGLWLLFEDTVMGAQDKSRGTSLEASTKSRGGHSAACKCRRTAAVLSDSV